MKHSFYLLAIVLLFGACTEDIDLIAPYKECAIVNALLDKSDTAHYIIINRGFVNPDRDAIEISSNIDSIYFRGLDVEVQEIDPNGNVLHRYYPIKLDLNEEGYVKQNGIFPTSPNYAYKFKAELNTDYSYRIVIVNGQKMYSLETPILDLDSNSLRVLPRFWIDSSSTIPLSFSSKTRINWSTTRGEIYSCFLNIPYYEVNSNNPLDTISKSIHWQLALNRLKKSFYSVDVETDLQELLWAIQSEMPAPETHVTRYLGLMSFHLYGGSQRMIDYLELVQGRGGLVSHQVTPEFRQGILTEDTYGLFDSRGSTHGYNLRFEDNVYQHIFYSEQTADLQIRGLIK